MAFQWESEDVASRPRPVRQAQPGRTDRNTVRLTSRQIQLLCQLLDERVTSLDIIWTHPHYGEPDSDYGKGAKELASELREIRGRLT